MALIQLEDYEEATVCGVQAAGEPRAYHMMYVMAALALRLNGQTAAAEKYIGEAFKKRPGFSLESYRNTLPHNDELSSNRVLIMSTLKKLGVPETSNV